MSNNLLNKLLLEWSDEVNISLTKTNSLCVALFNTEKELLFATPIMKSLFKGEPSKSLLNPTFEKLITPQMDSSLVFEGMMTIGDYNSINTSIMAHAFVKRGKLLIVGGADAIQLIKQNQSMHQLNQQINTLQRELIKEKSKLENTLQELKTTNKELTQTIKTKEKFFSIITHDLRSPFNAINGFSSLLVEQVKCNDLKGIEDYAQIIYQSSNQAMDLLMNLMEWSRSQTNRLEYYPENFDLTDFSKNIVLLYKEIANQKSIQIQNLLMPGFPIFADKAMINTILRNLISNAIKFTNPDGVITIYAKEDDENIILSVKDTGVGIPQNIIPKLFEVDQVCSKNGTNNEQGTGLGLILCKEFVEKHHGNIWVESKEGIGSIFSFSIPKVVSN